jgi:endonuclease/exonuclease/phosphatase family metal-dependent hydrolase
MQMHFCPTLGIGSGEYGIALAGPSLVAVERERLPGAELDPEPRWAVWARSEGTTYLCTHLSTHRGAKRLQLNALAGIARKLSPPLVVLGDLNQTGRCLGPLRAAGLRGDGRRHLTHSAAWPRHQIDWVLVRGGRIARAWTLATHASDHRPLAATLEV